VLLNDVVERAFDSLAAAGAGFLVTGIVLWSTRRATGEPDAGRPRWTHALAIGAAQAAAILPGISRSGSTVSAGLWCRLAPARAAEFSFLMAVPAIAGAALLESRAAVADIGTVGAVPLAAGCAVALVSGIWAIRFLVRVLQRGRLHGFGPYCWAVGALTLGIALWRG
jgi:undecaprenyl-diphosphatase